MMKLFLLTAKIVGAMMFLLPYCHTAVLRDIVEQWNLEFKDIVATSNKMLKNLSVLNFN